jgi:hypothetical protein
VPILPVCPVVGGGVGRVAKRKKTLPGSVLLQKPFMRWRAYLDTEDELVFYCPECAEREFGA